MNPLEIVHAAEPGRPVKPLPGLAPWIGGKHALAGHIAARIAAIPHRRHAEPFVGMGGVFFRRPTRARAEAINDRSGAVANLFRVAQRHPGALLTELRWALASRETFERAWAPPPETLTDIERAARFFHILKHNYGGKPDGRSFPARPLKPKGIDPGRLRAKLDAWHARLARVTVENLPYEDFIARHDRPETLFHLDPPYCGCEDYYGRELFSRDGFARLESLLAELKGRFILSLNDAPGVRRLFARFAIEAVETAYSAGGGSNARKAGELLISGP